MIDHQLLATWLSVRMDQMLRFPQMWGGQEAVEMQFLLLLEMDLLVHNPTLDEKHPRFILDKYHEFNRKKFKHSNTPASAKNLDWMEFTNHFVEFRASLKGTY